MNPVVTEAVEMTEETPTMTLRAHETLMNMAGTLVCGFGGMAVAGAAAHQQFHPAGIAACIVTPFFLKGFDTVLTMVRPMTNAKAAKTNATRISLNAMLPGAQTLARAVDKRRGTKHYEPA